MTHGSLFSGIGGFDLAAEWMGWENKFHCEWNEFGQKVLKHYWPNAELFTDITKSDFKKYHGAIDIISGGFPCQPYSTAGKRLGKEDSRHLWPQMLRAIREIQPRWIVGENVLGLINWSDGLVFHEVQTDLEAEGYEVQPVVLAAAGVGAPHRRDRIWFVAYSTGRRAGSDIGGLRGMFNGCDQRKEDESLAADTDNTGTDNILRTERNREKENNGRDEQLFSEHWQNGSNGNASNTERFRLDKCEDTAKVGGTQAEVGRQGNKFTNAVEADGKAANATDTHGNGCNERNCKHEKHSGQRGVNALGHTNESNDNGNAADPEQPGFQGQHREWEGCSEHRVDEGVFIGSENKLNASDTMRTRGWKNNREGESKFFDENGKIGAWDIFPTQSPICGRNDGVPNRLDGITFPKWRNESIKAYGNAVCPQVVHQIFKAIEQYEQLNTQLKTST
jgi:DNA (cytosine-5)-methyltransferase 1